MTPPHPDVAWLAAFLAAHGGVAGSVHRRVGEVLVATAFQGIPPAVQALTTTIPPGKGMAGLAWTRGTPVSTCNLATDPTDDIRPGARTVAARAAVALPIFDDQHTLRAVVGIAFADAADPPIERLLAAAASLRTDPLPD